MNRKKIKALFALLLIHKHFSKPLFYTEKQLHQAQNTNIGKGRGIIKTLREKLPKVDRFHYFQDKPRSFKIRFRMTREEFHTLFTELEQSFAEKVQESTIVTKLTFQNKILLFFEFIFHYEKYSTLSGLYNVSPFVISTVIHELLPHMVDFFVKFIEGSTPSKPSVLDNRILFVLDGTVHPMHKTSFLQHIFYSGKEETHCIQTQVLIDHNGFIKCIETGLFSFISFFQPKNSLKMKREQKNQQITTKNHKIGKNKKKTGIPGSMHDATCARRSKSIQKVVGKDFCLTDPGYEGVSYCVAGITRARIQTKADKIFNTVSRREQKPVEHVNNFLKKCSIISNDSRFRHNNFSLFSGSVLVVCGLYNYKKRKGWAYLPRELISQ